MSENNISKALEKKKGKDDSKELNESEISDSNDEFDWDFLLEREWSRTKK